MRPPITPLSALSLHAQLARQAGLRGGEPAWQVGTALRCHPLHQPRNEQRVAQPRVQHGRAWKEAIREPLVQRQEPHLVAHSPAVGGQSLLGPSHGLARKQDPSHGPIVLSRHRSSVQPTAPKRAIVPARAAENNAFFWKSPHPAGASSTRTLNPPASWSYFSTHAGPSARRTLPLARWPPRAVDSRDGCGTPFLTLTFGALVHQVPQIVAGAGGERQAMARIVVAGQRLVRPFAPPLLAALACRPASTGSPPSLVRRFHPGVATEASTVPRRSPQTTRNGPQRRPRKTTPGWRCPQPSRCSRMAGDEPDCAASHRDDPDYWRLHVVRAPLGHRSWPAVDCTHCTNVRTVGERLVVS